MKRKPVVNIGVQRFDKLREQGSFLLASRIWKKPEHEYARMLFSKKYEGRAEGSVHFRIQGTGFG